MARPARRRYGHPTVSESDPWSCELAFLAREFVGQARSQISIASICLPNPPRPAEKLARPYHRAYAADIIASVTAIACCRATGSHRREQQLRGMRRGFVPAPFRMAKRARAGRLSKALAKAGPL